MDKEQAFDFLKRMDVILRTMREKEGRIIEDYSPYKIKHSEGHETERVIFPPEGGTLLYYKGVSHPMKGIFFSEVVEAVDEVKKNLMVLVRSFGSFRSKLKLLLFGLLFRKEIERVAVESLEMFDRKLEKFRLKPNKYCRAVREVYRAFERVRYFEDDDSLKKVLVDVRDIVCMILEYDDSYRYRFQNIIVKLNQRAIKNNIIKELRRLFDVAVEKETVNSIPTDRTIVSNKLRSLKKTIFILYFTKRIKKILIKFLRELKIEELAMDEDDLYFASPKGFKK